MRYHKDKFAAFSVLTGILLAGTCGAFAKDLRFATGHGPSAPITRTAEAWAKEVGEKSAGDITIKVFPMTLLGYAELSGGLRDGLADVGNLIVAFDPGTYPYLEFLGDLAFALAPDQKPTDALGYAGAISEFVMLECEQCRADFTKQNQVFLGGGATGIQDMLCADKKVEKVEDIKGTRFRVGTESYSRFISTFNGAPVRMDTKEVLEGLNQGVVDCAVLTASDIDNFRLEEVVKNVTAGVPGGSYAGMTAGNFNLDTWKGLTDAQRAVLIGAYPTLTAGSTYGYYFERDKTLVAAKARGTNIITPSPEFAGVVREYREKQRDFVIKFYQEKHGLADAQQVVDKFSPVLERWLGLVKDVKTADDLSALYREHIYSKVQSNYGL